MKYSAPLDGIRALSIVAVLVNHANGGLLPGGFTGVDVFFVLSGYLITRIIGGDLDSGQFSFREFYLRRVQRLIPNLIAMLLAVLAAVAFLLPKGTSATHGMHAMWTLLNGANIFNWRKLGDYWGVRAESSPLTHAWSLAVEEQFYLVYPLLFVLLWRWRRRLLLPVLIIGFLVSLAGNLYLTKKIPSAAFYLLPSRGWELLAGSLLALVIRKNAPHRSNFAAAMGWMGMAMLLCGFGFIDETVPFPGYSALLPVAGSVLLIGSVEIFPQGVGRMLSARPVVAIGKASYSLYLWHWPALVITRIMAVQLELPMKTAAWAGITGGILLALIAYHGIETPMRKRGEGRRNRLIWIAAGAVAAWLLSSWLVLRPLEADRYSRFDPIVFSGNQYDTRWSSADYLKEKKSAHIYDVVSPPILDVWMRNRWREGGLIRRYGSDGRPRVVVFGSSHAMMYSRVIDELCQELQIPVAFFGVVGGGPSMFEATADPSYKGPFESRADAKFFDEVRRRFLGEWKPDLVILIDRWDSKYQADSLGVSLQDFLRDVRKDARRVAFVTQVPVHIGGNYVNLREVVSARTSSAADPLPLLFPDNKDTVRRLIAERAERVARVDSLLRVIRPDLEFYHADGSIRYAEGRKFYYMDEDHLSDAGAERVKGLFAELLTGLSGASRGLREAK